MMITKRIMKRLSNLETEKFTPVLWRLKQTLRYEMTRTFVSETNLGITWTKQTNGKWEASETTNLTVPEGFITDGVRSPRSLAWVCSPMGGRYAEAAVLHDYLYSPMCERSLSRKQCDKYFYGAMRADGVGLVKAWAMYLSVRFFGGKFFKRSLYGK